MENDNVDSFKIGSLIIGKGFLLSNLIACFCFFLICVFFFPYLSSWVHELSHFLLANLYGFENVQLEVYYPMGGNITFSMDPYLPFDDPRIEQLRMVLIAGSLGDTIFLLSLLFISSISKKIRFSLYIPIFLLTFFMITHEITYWITGMSVLGSDSYQFLNITPQISPNDLSILIICIFLLIIIAIALLVIWKFYITINKNKK